MKRPLAVLMLALLALPLGGCGFHPLYAMPGQAKGAMRQKMQAVYVEPVPDRTGYELRNHLIDLLDGASRPAKAAYRLRLTLDKKSDAVAVQSQKVAGENVTETAITRYNDLMTVEYELTDVQTGAVLTHGMETGLSAYNVLSSPYATLVAQQDADKRAAEDIGDRIRIALATYFAHVK
jgi:LPS-assembly lipoprotein